MRDEAVPSPDADAVDPHLSDLSRSGSRLGQEMVELGGFLDLVDETSQGQLEYLGQVRVGANDILAANARVIEAVETVSASTDTTLETVQASVDRARDNARRYDSVATWVQALDRQMTSVSETLQDVQATNDTISSIASQVNILAINAKIEAARAGESGRGFAVVAEAINELSHKTGRAAQDILDSIQNLTVRIDSLRREAAEVAGDATEVLAASGDADSALTHIADRVRTTHEDARMIADAAGAVKRTSEAFAPCFDRISGGIEGVANDIHKARNRINSLIDQSEGIVQSTVSLGGSSDDAAFIAYVRDRAAAVGAVFADAIAGGRIARGDLFAFRYTPVPNTNPEQYLAPFTRLTDAVLPNIQERALSFDPNVVFCAAVTRDGYLPTHNRKFSQRQRPGDPVWNAANARNRRIFNDRVGLKAGRNTRPFLLQVYRRDMGGGTFVMMKDLSAPIMVDGMHWGGLRLAYRFT